MILVFKYLCSWFQYLVVIVKVGKFRDDHFVKHKSKEYNLILKSNFTNDLKLEYDEIINVKFYGWFLYSNVFAVDFNTRLW